jgi:hypothetical protein
VEKTAQINFNTPAKYNQISRNLIDKLPKVDSVVHDYHASETPEIEPPHANSIVHHYRCIVGDQH